MTVGREYEVHAISVTSGIVYFHVVNDLKLPSWLPGWLFEVTNGYLPDDWIGNAFHGEVALIIGPDFVARDDDALSAMSELQLDQVNRGRVVAEAAFSVQPGRIVDRVVETEQGFQVVKVLAREEGRGASYEELRETIRARLTTDRRDKAFKEFVDAIWSRADVKIDEKALEMLATEKMEKRSR